MGLGWRLSIPYIVRKNTHGADQLYSRSDFTSSEDGDLVLSQTSGNVQTYVPLSTSTDFPTYTFNTSTNTWQLTTKTGTVLTFGDSASTRQDDQNNSADIFKWMLSKQVDTNSNSITYSYTKNAGQIYPSSINYAGNGSSSGVYGVGFSLASVSTPAQVSYATGFAVQTNSEISQITTNFNGTAIRTYTLSYSTDTRAKKPVLTTIALSATNSSGTVNPPSTTFTYADGSGGWGSESSTWQLPTDSTLAANCGGTFITNLADLNGDGLTDVIYSCAGSLSDVFLNNGNGWTHSTTWQLPVDSTFAANCGASTYVSYYFADLNGDGLPDYELACGSFFSDVYLNTGSGWATSKSTTWGLPVDSAFNANCGTVTNLQVSFADVNGDGLNDLIYSCAGSLSEVFLNNGSGFTASTNWALPVDSTFAANCGSVAWVSYIFADLNGDGLPDYILNCKGLINDVFLNNGSGWATAQSTTWAIPTDPTFAANCGGTFQLSLADVNGDGLTDVVFGCAGSLSETFLNNGSGYTKDTTWQLPVDSTFGGNCGGAPIQYYFLDLTGSDVADYILSCSGLINDVYLSNAGTYPKITSITLPQGGTVSVNYQSSIAYKDGSGNPTNPALPFPVQTVSSITMSDPVNSVSGTTNYSYAGGTYFVNSSNVFDRKFAGFQKVTQTDPAGNVTITYYHTGLGTDSTHGEYADDEYKIGHIYRIEQYDSANHLFAKTISKWSDSSIVTGADLVKLDQTLTSEYDGGSGHKDSAIAYTYNTSNGNTTQKTEYGQVTGSDDGTFSGSAQFTTAYTYASGGSVTGLPSDITVTNSGSSKVKETKYFYDGSTTLGSVTKGNLTEQDDWIFGSTYAAQKKTYDGTYGLVTQSKDADGNATNYSYDTYNLYPATVTNALSQSTGYTYDYTSGQVAQTTDVNGFVFKNTYDGLGRLTLSQQPDLTTPTTLVNKTTYTYTDTAGAVGVHESDSMDGTTSIDTYTYYDGLGRAIQTRKSAEDSGNFNVQDFAYNNLGLLSQESLPYVSSGTSKTSANTTSSLLITYGYDALARLTSTTNTLGTTLNSYSTPWQVTITDPNSHTKDLIKDAFGNLVQVNEHNGVSTYTTTYTYDYLGDLLSITDANSNVRNFTYDGLGRRLSAQDLHTATATTIPTWTYAYDAQGNQTQTVDPNGNTINYTYDALNRQALEKLGSTTKVTYSYDSCADGVGRLCTVTAPSVTTTDTYNDLGLLASEIKTISSTNYETDYAYDRQGHQLTITSPDSSKVIYTYNLAGLPETVQRKETTDGSNKNVVTNFDYSPVGTVSTIAYANGATTTNTYDSTKLYRLTHKVTAVGASNIQDISYTYDPVGNITAITDNSTTDTKKTISYGYDPLNRLTSYTVTGAANGNNHSETYTYDPVGNIASKSDQGSYTYAGTGSPNPDAVTAVGSNTFTYDSNGNLLTSSTGGGTSAISLDATSTSITNGFNSGPITKTWSHTTGSGSSRLLVLTADIWQDTGGTGTISSASYGGVALTKGTTIREFNMSAEVWYLKNPPTGANTMSVTVSGATDAIKLATSTYTGVDQTAPYVAATTAVGTSGNPTISRTTVNASALLVATLSRYTTTAATTNRTSLYNDHTGSTLGAASYQLATSTGSYSDTYTGSSANDWAMIMAEFKPTSTGSTMTNTWDYNDRLTQTQITGSGAATVTYAYDQNGERVQYGNGTTTTVYPSKYYYTDGTTPTKQIYAAGQLIATIKGTGAGAAAYSVNTDQLTGANIVTDSTGAIKEVLDYYPFGTSRLDEQTGFNEPIKFDGHLYDTDTAFSYQDARYYNPAFGRWLSEDPIYLEVGSGQFNTDFAQSFVGTQYQNLNTKSLLNNYLSNPQTLNPYSYVANSPVRYIDPNGRYELIDDALLFVGGGILGVTEQKAVDKAFGVKSSTKDYINSAVSSAVELNSTEYVGPYAPVAGGVTNLGLKYLEAGHITLNDIAETTTSVATAYVIGSIVKTPQVSPDQVASKVVSTNVVNRLIGSAGETLYRIGSFVVASVLFKAKGVK